MFSTTVRYFAMSVKNFRLYRGYLIPKPPAKPKGGFSWYIKQRGCRRNFKDVSVEWMALTKEQKKYYTEASIPKDYPKRLEEYREKFMRVLDYNQGKSPYSLYLKENIKAKTMEEAQEQNTNLSKAWKELPEEEVQKYIEQFAAVNKQRLEALQRISKYQVPPDNVKSAIQLFNEDRRNNGSLMRWVNLTEAEKSNYQKQSDAAREVYEKQLERFCVKNGLTVSQLRSMKDEDKQKRQDSAKRKLAAKSTPKQAKRRTSVLKKDKKDGGEGRNYKQAQHVGQKVAPLKASAQQQEKHINDE